MLFNHLFMNHRILTMKTNKEFHFLIFKRSNQIVEITIINKWKLITLNKSKLKSIISKNLLWISLETISKTFNPFITNPLSHNLKILNIFKEIKISTVKKSYSKILKLPPKTLYKMTKNKLKTNLLLDFQKTKSRDKVMKLVDNRIFFKNRDL